MDKQTWLEATQQERAIELKSILQKIVEIDKGEAEYCKTAAMPPNGEKFKLEQRVLHIFEWEREENE